VTLFKINSKRVWEKKFIILYMTFTFSQGQIKKDLRKKKLMSSLHKYIKKKATPSDKNKKENEKNSNLYWPIKFITRVSWPKETN